MLPFVSSLKLTNLKEEKQFVSSLKLRNLEEERQRFIIASIQLISHLNQKILAEMPNSEFVEFQKSLVGKVRETTDAVSSEELQSIIGLIDDSFYGETAITVK